MQNKKTISIVLFFSISLCIFCIPYVRAVIPQVQNVVFRNDGSVTILDVTINHTPNTSSHHVSQVEVDIEGIITSYSVTQTATTFTASINLGEINGEPSARVRAFCTVDGWSSWTNQQNIPEFSSWLLIPLFLIISVVVLVSRHYLWNNS